MKPDPPYPFPLKRLHGNPGHQRLHAEPEPQREAKCPEPPPFLRPYAQDEWRRVAPELHRLGLLTGLDNSALAAIAKATRAGAKRKRCWPR